MYDEKQLKTAFRRKQRVLFSLFQIIRSYVISLEDAFNVDSERSLLRRNEQCNFIVAEISFRELQIEKFSSFRQLSTPRREISSETEWIEKETSLS